MQLVGRVYANCIICKHLGQVGVTKEHIMCANAIICTYVAGLEIGLDRSWREGVRKSYYVQALREIGCDHRAPHVRKCYYVHVCRGGWKFG